MSGGKRQARARATGGSNPFETHRRREAELKGKRFLCFYSPEDRIWREFAKRSAQLARDRALVPRATKGADSSAPFSEEEDAGEASTHMHRCDAVSATDSKVSGLQMEEEADVWKWSAADYWQHHGPAAAAGGGKRTKREKRRACSIVEQEDPSPLEASAKAFPSLLLPFELKLVSSNHARAGLLLSSMIGWTGRFST